MIGGVRASAKVRSATAHRLELRTLLLDWASCEAGRAFLWTPVLLIIGIAGYFSQQTEPSLWLVIAGLAGSFTLWKSARWLRYGAKYISWLGRGMVFIALGVLLAQLRTQIVDAPIIPNETPPLRIEGQLLHVENRPKSQRFLIAPTKIGGMAQAELPAKVRLTWRGKPSTAQPGDIVALRGVLAPPPGPALPGGFDYGRQLFFERIGGVGFSYEAPRPIWRPKNTPWQARLTHLRHQISVRIMSKAGPEAGPVLSAMVTGLRAPIPPEITAQLRDTGLAHLLAISGLHMGLVCGFLFFCLRFAFSLNPSWTAQFPVKKWAAMGALLGGVIYLGLSGGSWSTQRAFIMAAVSFVAILADRRAISLRNIALAALIILIYRPEAVLSAGFQMSFSAVIALVATYDAWRVYGPKIRVGGYSVIARCGRFFAGIFSTSLIAGAATAPYAIYHFGRIANFGMVANIAVMPLFTIGVMPIAVIGLAVMPLGIDAPFWAVAGAAFEVLLHITQAIAAWPHAVMMVPQWPPIAWLTLVAGLLGASLLSAPWRLAAFMAVPLAMGLAYTAPVPVVHIAEEAKNIGVLTVVDGQRAVALFSRRKERFAVKQWIEAYAIESEIRDLPKFGECKQPLCEATIGKGADILVYTEDQKLALEACSYAAVVVTPIWNDRALKEQCQALLLTANSLHITGPVALYQDKDEYSIRAVYTERGERPWTRR